jgi:hypothetical protein
MIHQSKNGVVIKSQFLHSSLAGVVRLCSGLFLAFANCAKLLGQNYFTVLNQLVLTFLHPILICRVTYCAQLEML